MHHKRLPATLLACFTIFPAFANAFWRLPCRGRTGVARLDPLVEPGRISAHAHSIHGAGSFGMDSDQHTLRKSNCTSCAVQQDLSAYWTPALYFMHPNGSAELVEEVGGMLAYYFLYGDNITAFPQNFRMIAGDPFQRNFTWPIPDPPKSFWTGAQESQAALRQKALGFNCLNYAKPAEPSLGRHFMPNKTFLDEHCTDGIRLEMMFPSCWNGRDVDSPDHKSHVAYPSLVMDGTCPHGYETRLVSLFYETIWNTYAFKDKEGFFALANGDPTGFGYHGDFMQGWEEGVLQRAVDTCTNGTGMVEDCAIFDLQTETDQRQCWLDLPPQLQHENVHIHPHGLPGNVPIEWGPAYALPRRFSGFPSPTKPLDSNIATSSVPTLSLSLGLDPGDLAKLGGLHVTKESTTTFVSSSTSTHDSHPAPTAPHTGDSGTQEIFYLEEDIEVLVNDKGVPYSTSTGTIRTVSSTATTIATTQTATADYLAQKDSRDATPVDCDQPAPHAHRRVHHHHGNFHQRRQKF